MSVMFHRETGILTDALGVRDLLGARVGRGVTILKQEPGVINGSKTAGKTVACF